VEQVHSTNHEASPSTTWADHEIMWCLTLTRGLTPTELLSRYGADPDKARLVDRQHADALGRRIGDEGLSATVLRVGALDDWSFCLEHWGWLGTTEGLLTGLSRATETFSLQQDARGRQSFQFWRDGHRMEPFEPGMPSTRPQPPHPWWEAVELRSNESGEELPGWQPVLRAVSDHTGVALDDVTVNSPLLTLLLHEDSQGYGVIPRRPQKSLGYGLRLIQTDNRQEP
jgi:hypothetical protein